MVASLVGLSMIVWPNDTINLYDPGFATLNLSTFAGPATPLELWVLLSGIGMFELWVAALLVIGYSTAARVTRLRAAAWVVGLWAAWLALLVAAAALE